MLKNGVILNIQEISCKNNNYKNIYIKGKRLSIIGNICDNPINTDVLNMYEVVEKKDVVVSLLEEVQCKMIFMQIFEVSNDIKKLYVMPLLHT